MQSYEERADELLRIMGGTLDERMQRNVLRRLVLAEDRVAELMRELHTAKTGASIWRDERDRLRHALVTRGGLDQLAQCPSCMAERTNGERHSDDCPLMLLVDAIREGRTAEQITTCRCGRPAYLGASDGVPRCPACEYLPCETCDCVPSWGR